MTKGHTEIWARAALSAVPYVGGPAEIVYSGYRNRAASRANAVLAMIADQFEEPSGLDIRLAASEPLDALFGRALRAAAESGLASKRTALGRVVVSALDDEALIDHAGLLVDVLAQIEAPHVRAMVQIRAAVDEVKRRGEWPVRAAGAEHEIITHVREVGDQIDGIVIRNLKNLGLLFAGETSDRWYVHDLTLFGYELLDFLVEANDDDSLV